MGENFKIPRIRSDIAFRISYLLSELFLAFSSVASKLTADVTIDKACCGTT